MTVFVRFKKIGIYVIYYFIQKHISILVQQLNYNHTKINYNHTKTSIKW